jgi:hypothetical protein
MVKLYRYDTQKGKWILVDFGPKDKADSYARQGYLVVYL